MTNRRADASLVGTYVMAIVIIAALTITGVVSLVVLRPTADNSQVITILVGLVTPIMVTLLGLIQRENHLAMNSRLDQVVTLTGDKMRAEGVIAGTAAAESAPAHTSVAVVAAQTATTVAAEARAAADRVAQVAREAASAARTSAETQADVQVKAAEAQGVAAATQIEAANLQIEAATTVSETVAAKPPIPPA